MTAGLVRELDVVEPAYSGVRPQGGLQGVVSADGKSVRVVWDKGGTAVERVEDLVLVGRPSSFAIVAAPVPVEVLAVEVVPVKVEASIRFVGRAGTVRHPGSARQLRELLEENIPVHTTVDQVLVSLLGKDRLARALFESDEAVLQFVDRVSDAMLGDEPADDDERRQLDRRVARAMQTAWDRNELGARARYEVLVARLLEQLRSST